MAVMKKEETGRQENGWHKLKIGSNVENRQEQVIEFGQINKILNTKLLDLDDDELALWFTRIFCGL